MASHKKHGGSKWLGPKTHMEPVKEEERWSEEGPQPDPDVIRNWLLAAMQTSPDDLENCLKEIKDRGWHTQPELLRACKDYIARMRGELGKAAQDLQDMLTRDDGATEWGDEDARSESEGSWSGGVRTSVGSTSVGAGHCGRYRDDGNHGYGQPLWG